MKKFPSVTSWRTHLSRTRIDLYTMRKEESSLDPLPAQPWVCLRADGSQWSRYKRLGFEDDASSRVNGSADEPCDVQGEKEKHGNRQSCCGPWPAVAKWTH